MFKARVLAATALLFAALTLSAQVPTAITADPTPDKDNPPAVQTFQIPSHGVGLNALMYVAPGAGPHPVVVLLHGFPGNEKNLDLAQSIRRAGWDVLYFDYRGSWGTLGDFSFTHCMEDTVAALAYLRDPAHAAKLRVDPARIVLMGHSMGGMIAVYTAAYDPKVLGLAVFAAADMAGRAVLPAGAPDAARDQMLTGLTAGLANEGMEPLAGTTPAQLARELIAHPEWSLSRSAGGLKSLPVLIVTTNDGGRASADHLAEAIKTAGNTTVRTAHLESDHSFSGKRIALEEAILEYLEQIKSR